MCVVLVSSIPREISKRSLIAQAPSGPGQNLFLVGGLYLCRVLDFPLSPPHPPPLPQTVPIRRSQQRYYVRKENKYIRPKETEKEKGRFLVVLVSVYGSRARYR